MIVPGSVAIIAIICAQNLAIVINGTFPALSSVIVPAAVLTVVLAVANAIGVRWGATVQNVTVVTKVGALVAIIFLAIVAGTEPVTDPVTTREDMPRGWGIGAAVFAALVPAFFSYGGWQQVMWIGGEVKDPQRTLPPRSRSACSSSW
ncbi:MAG: amino acid permease [Planctomycetes bacterium]|nr:amino acid permease [Planctomycetota bacterium]